MLREAEGQQKRLIERVQGGLVGRVEVSQLRALGGGGLSEFGELGLLQQGIVIQGKRLRDRRVLAVRLSTSFSFLLDEIPLALSRLCKQDKLGEGVDLILCLFPERSGQLELQATGPSRGEEMLVGGFVVAEAVLQQAKFEVISRERVLVIRYLRLEGLELLGDFRVQVYRLIQQREVDEVRAEEEPRLGHQVGGKRLKDARSEEEERGVLSEMISWFAEKGQQGDSSRIEVVRRCGGLEQVGRGETKFRTGPVGLDEGVDKGETHNELDCRIFVGRRRGGMGEA